MAHKTVNVAEYLYARLHQLGVRALHGLPGDFNLLALDYVESSGLKWVGNCNELNAGYAADGYARTKGIGAIVTTFGVGELSAINAVAGSFSEFVPVVHIVGTPSTASQREGMLLHHTLGNGDFRVFADIHQRVTLAQADLVDPLRAPAEIDRVLRQCYVESRPVYIQLPTDVVVKHVDARLLDSPIDLSTPKSNPGAEDRVVCLILEKIYAASKPIILVDAGAQRHRVLDETEEFVRKSGLPTYVAPMGKGAIDESLPNFVGLYAGLGCYPDIQKAVEASDLVITVGNVKSDLNTAGFTYRISQLHSIDLHFDNIVIDYAKYEKVYFKWILQRLVHDLEPSKLSQSARELPPPFAIPHAGGEVFPPEAITHAYLWPRISSWLRKGDILVSETGTSYVGIWETRLPAGVSAISQVLWSSIGYALGAAQGAAIAAKELNEGQRTICFQGDGSFQLTAQELSTIIHHDLNVIVFLIENDGYTIERWVHGMEAKYNDVPQWRYDKIPEALTPEKATASKRVKTWKIATRAELERLLLDGTFADGKGLQFVEMHMPRTDAPKTLREFGENAAKRAS